ncbi:putative threonine efflux protein [Mycobacteroides abscessus]|uniref:GAP family protein n=1 Tax=Mycobacteroides abscessus TaxID=36809 RepID=UPI0005DA8DCE|nr:GAP family protein [Mycobacteroides abscessus]MBN7318603.1 GAP family protein [Mycobacteroides abscessus subsp. massiliense]CPU33576.1 putative threonine efflux protein [Mycobacteroides abscessus]CPX73731.1 putative threonine efflux protein [Mycobacteroides abscessus]CPZ76464.1 putative threonine efflux protein [Mycobacteroides abscessus]
MRVELVSLALFIAVSPASVIPAILMLHTPRPLATGWAFAAGWALSLTLAAGLFVSISGKLGDPGGPPPHWIRPVTLVLAVLLIVAGVTAWMRRGRRQRAPVWLRALDSVTPRRALSAAPVLVAANPKVLSACAAAGFSVAAAAGTSVAQWGQVTGFALLASVTVLLPVLCYAIWRERMAEPLRRLRVALERHNSAILAVILLAVGLMLLLQTAR